MMIQSSVHSNLGWRVHEGEQQPQEIHKDDGYTSTLEMLGKKG